MNVETEQPQRRTVDSGWPAVIAYMNTYKALLHTFKQLLSDHAGVDQEILYRAALTLDHEQTEYRGRHLELFASDTEHAEFIALIDETATLMEGSSVDFPKKDHIILNCRGRMSRFLNKQRMD